MSDGLWSIGELAQRAGVTVKTVRFYSDEGLLPEAGRSVGGHRRYGPEALDRLRMIRSLRALDLPVTDVGPALDGGDALESALAARLDDVGAQLAALRWREAGLRLVRDSPPAERAERLRLFAAVPTPPDTTALERFWRLTLPPRLPARLRAAILEESVPPLPADPTPDQVMALARLHSLVSAAFRADCPEDRPRPDEGCDATLLYEGLAEAHALAVAAVHRSPHAGEALDCFVAAHARARSAKDTPSFRRRLDALLTRAANPLIARYWQLTGELSPGPTPGATDAWLRAALRSP